MTISVEHLTLHVATAFEKGAPDRAVLAYAWPQTWSGGDSIQAGERKVAVHACVSPLDLRDQLSERNDGPLVLLVPFAESELGEDVLCRLYTRQLIHVDRWKLVEEAFETRSIDPRLYSMSWLPEALLSLPERERIAYGAGALTYARAMEMCLRHVLDQEELRTDLASLIAALMARAQAWLAQREEQADALSRYLIEAVGSTTEAVLNTVDAGNAHALLSIGLACELLYGEAANQDEALRNARVRLEPVLGKSRLSPAQGQQWSQAAQKLLVSLEPDDQRIALREASELLQRLDATQSLSASDLLPESIELRLSTLGRELARFAKGKAAIEQVQLCYQTLRQHKRLGSDHAGLKAAIMAMRLCQYLAVGENGSTDPQAHINGGAWVDWARRDLRAVQPAEFARGVSQLLDKIAAERQSLDSEFAKQLVHHCTNDTMPKAVLPIEKALARLVAPVARQCPVLLIVLDGMSWDVYLSLSEALPDRGWDPRRIHPEIATLLATIPSVTECSRASLLSGKLARTAAPGEKSAFAMNLELVQTSSARKAPLLMHKAELTQDQQLSEQAIQALRDPEQRVVGAVLNAIDDSLAKSDQIQLDWSLSSIPMLEALLSEARLAGRAVVLTSDHGHVLERNSQMRAGSDGERWRRTPPDPQDGEILVRGHRVESLMQGSVCVPYTESLRYAPKKNGYHGGVCMQEMYVPIGLWMPNPELAEAFPSETTTPPAWWELGATSVPQSRAVPPSPPRAKPKASLSGHPDLFSARSTDWIDALLASEMLKVQQERMGRLALSEERLRQLLSCLDGRGGRATYAHIASATGQPMMRVRGIVTTLQRTLNVDGYAVVSMETGSSTVMLDTGLLRKQFDL